MTVQIEIPTLEAHDRTRVEVTALRYTRLAFKSSFPTLSSLAPCLLNPAYSDLLDTSVLSACSSVGQWFGRGRISEMAPALLLVALCVVAPHTRYLAVHWRSALTNPTRCSTHAYHCFYRSHCAAGLAAAMAGKTATENVFYVR